MSGNTRKKEIYSIYIHGSDVVGSMSVEGSRQAPDTSVYRAYNGIKKKKNCILQNGHQTLLPVGQQSVGALLKRAYHLPLDSGG